MAPPGSPTASGGTQQSADTGFIAGTPKGATQELFDATHAAPSRYDITAPPPPSSRESLPPPGWGPRGSTTSWSVATGRTPSAIPPPKIKKRSSGSNFLKEIQGYLKVLAVLAVAAVVVIVFLQTRANTTELKITILGTVEDPVSGTLVVRDSSGAELAKKQISESGARCTYYKRVDITIRVKKSTDYVVEWDGTATTPLSDSELGSKGYALILDTRGGLVSATSGAPTQVC
jgi:hypothetical protein